MLTKSLVAAATALAATAAISLPADAAPNSQVRGTVIFWLLDRNADGQIDRSEVEALRTVIFDAVDSDSDGKVTREEFMAVIGERGGPMRSDRHDRPRHGQWEQRDGPGKGDFAARRGEGMMHFLGIDEDGLTRGDFVSATPRQFERADADDNGSVSHSEFEQASRHVGRLMILE